MMKAQPFNFRDLTANSADGVAPAAGGRFFVPVGGRANAAVQEAEAAPPSPPTFSEDDLKKAEMEGYKKGFIEGTKEGQVQAQTEQADIDKELLAKVEGFLHSIGPLFASYQSLTLELREQLPRVAQSIAQKIAGHGLAENAYAVIEDVAMNCVNQMVDEPRVSITVHESLADTLRTKMIDALTLQHSTMQLLVIPSATMERADCRIEWAGGLLERSTGSLWQRVEKAISDMSLASVRDTTEELTELKAQLPIVDAPVAPKAIEAPEVVEIESLPPESLTKE